MFLNCFSCQFVLNFPLFVGVINACYSLCDLNNVRLKKSLAKRSEKLCFENKTWLIRQNSYICILEKKYTAPKKTFVQFLR